MEQQIREISKVIMAIDPTKNRTMHPKQHYGLYPFYLEVRENLHVFGQIIREERREALRRLFDEDMKREDEELRMIGRAFMPN